MAKSSYRSIAKTNTILGGVQFLSIVIGIIRSKLVAVLLGPTGIGLMGLFQSTIDLVKSSTNMGIGTSAVRDVAVANDTHNEREIGQTVIVLSRVIWITGLLGFFIMLIGAPWLSKLTFGNQEYAWAFRILSVVPLISQLTVQYNVLLQGTRTIKRLAMAGIWGGLVGLFINVPMFYLWGEKAIVPVLIVVAIASFIITWYNASRLSIKPVAITWKDTFIKGKGMIKMGFFIGLTSLMDMAAIYIIKVYIQRWGSLSDVGLYTAGFAIVQQYVNLIFSAISTDYYPRLSAVSNSRDEYCDTINKQFEILILVLTPMVLVFMSFSSEILYVLYSTKFIAAKMMICWLSFGMLFRAYSWCPGYMYLAKSDTKIYFIIYILAFILELLLFLGGYYWLGLTGIGIAFGLQYFIGNIYGLLIIKYRYSFKYGKTQNKLMALSVLGSSIVLFIIYMCDSWWRYLLCLAIISLSALYSYKELDKRLDVKELIRTRFVKK